MKKLIYFCLITIMILSSVSIVWADDNPLYITPYEIKVHDYDLAATYDTFKQLSIVNTSNSAIEVTYETKILSSTYEMDEGDIGIVDYMPISIPPNSEKQITIDIDSSVVGQFKAELLFRNNLNNLIKKVPIHTTDDVIDGPDPNYKPLTISPSEINLTGNPGNQLVAKSIAITNKHSSGTVNIEAKPIYGCDASIIDQTKSLYISKGSTKNAYFTVRMPEYGDGFQVDLEMKLNGCNTKTILPIYNITKMLTIKDVKATYDYYTKDYTITWDLLPYISKYRIYNGTEYELANAIESDKGKHIIRNVTPQEATTLTRTLVAVNQIDEKISYDALVIYREDKTPYFPKPTNLEVKYDTAKEQHVITWDPPLGAETNKYKVTYVYEKYGELFSKSETMENRELRVDANPTDDRTYSVRAQSSTYGWGIPISAQYIPAPQNITCTYDSANKECKLAWENSSSNVDSFMVYSSYNGNPYQFEQHTSSLSYSKSGVNENDVNKYKFKVMSVHNNGLTGDSTEICLTKEYLASTKSLEAYINIRDNTANISWSEIPGANSYKIYVSLNGGGYYSVGEVTGTTEYLLPSPPPYDPPKDMTLKIKVKATNVYAPNQNDVIATVTFPGDPIHPGRP